MIKSLGCPGILFSGGGSGGSSALQPVVPTPKDKSGAPPVRSIHDDLVTSGTPLSAHKQVGLKAVEPKFALKANKNIVKGNFLFNAAREKLF